MAHTISVQLPDEVYDLLNRQAAATGRRVEDVVTEWLARYRARAAEALTPEESERRERRFENHFGAWDSGDPNSCDNARLDADIATELTRRSATCGSSWRRGPR